MWPNITRANRSGLPPPKAREGIVRHLYDRKVSPLQLHRAFTSAFFSFLLLLATSIPSGAFPQPRVLATDWPEVDLKLVTGGLVRPTSIKNAGDGSNRLFITEQPGRVRVYRNGSLDNKVFLDITSKVLDQGAGSELGLLDVVFPPGYSAKGYFYVSYTARTDANVVIARYRLAAGSTDQADATSEEVILRIKQPLTNHFAGQMAFGPKDGYLYIGVGDGDGESDKSRLAQNLTVLQGKILRIDTECCVGIRAYAIPLSNPFFDVPGARQEIWAYGFRNPWRFSFDRNTGGLYISDVGQFEQEEIDYQKAYSSGGENYGWNRTEASFCFERKTCDKAGITMPVSEYPHYDSADQYFGCAVIGGYVAHAGSSVLQGTYFYGDYCTGNIWALKRNPGCNWDSNLILGGTEVNITSFGEDEAGNLYLTSYKDGEILRINEINQKAVQLEDPVVPQAGVSTVFIPAINGPLVPDRC